MTCNQALAVPVQESGRGRSSTRRWLVHVLTGWWENETGELITLQLVLLVLLLRLVVPWKSDPRGNELNEAGCHSTPCSSVHTAEKNSVQKAGLQQKLFFLYFYLWPLYDFLTHMCGRKRVSFNSHTLHICVNRQPMFLCWERAHYMLLAQGSSCKRQLLVPANDQ